MLKIIKSINNIKFSELMCVYAESNLLNGIERYPELLQDAQIHEAEQDFYRYLNDVFFKQDGSFYAIEEDNGDYLAALRIEPYLDGLLICGLETKPDARRRGHAANLILEVLKYLDEKGEFRIYSHVSKKNLPSIKTHMKCGFQIIKDHAVYSDGSVLHNSYTLLYEKKSET